MIDNRLSAKRSYHRKIEQRKKLEHENAMLKQALSLELRRLGDLDNSTQEAMLNLASRSGHGPINPHIVSSFAAPHHMGVPLFRHAAPQKHQHQHHHQQQGKRQQTVATRSRKSPLPQPQATLQTVVQQSHPRQVRSVADSKKSNNLAAAKALVAVDAALAEQQFYPSGEAGSAPAATEGASATGVTTATVLPRPLAGYSALY